jgi:N-acetylmuramoyl-L-alanine amidase
VFCALAPAGAQQDGAAPTQPVVALVDAQASGLSETWLRRKQFTLQLSEAVPFRVFTLDAPRRLVLDFKTVDWSGVIAEDLLTLPEIFTSVQFGPFQPGWSRLVAELAEPLMPDDIEVDVDAVTGAATLSLALKATTEGHFAAKAGVPQDALWTVAEPALTPRAQTEDRFVVVIDPGHGGIDPGAERAGISEKALMLEIAVELQAALLRAGADEVVLTRQADVFVSLTSRVALAHQTGADVFISLHADALIEGGAEGATVYTLSEEATDKATEQLAARHNRADIIAGADLTGSDDEVAGVLLDLARQETEPRTVALAQALVTGMAAAGGPMNSRPLRQAGFSVLKSADIPSVLLEVGFLSSERDLENLLNPAWRARMVGAVANSIVAWRETDAALRALMRQ